MGFRVACVALASLLVACSSEPPAEQARTVASPAPASSSPPDGHSSRDALDWAGAYEGFLPCSGCPASFDRITLGSDGGFERTTRPLVADARPSTATGRFDWQTDGAAIALDAAGDNLRFQVGEGRLILLDSARERVGDFAGTGVLGKHEGGVTPGNPDLSRMLQDHAWTLRSAMDAAGAPMNSFLPDGVPAFVVSFDDDRVRFQGGCNGVNGSVAFEGSDRLRVHAMAATMMACDPARMAADAALGQMLAAPMTAIAARGAAPALALVADGGQVLLFSGEQTPRARYGEPTTIFLEVAAQQAPCDAADAGTGDCLQVREIEFDAQGLRVGTPGAFRSLPGGIEGFEHEAGTRSVLRIHRFPSPEGFGEGIHVLDLVVETEVAAR